MRKPQFAVGALLLFSIFFLPSLLPLPSVGLRQLLSDLAAAACVVFLDLQYWRHISAFGQKRKIVRRSEPHRRWVRMRISAVPSDTVRIGRNGVWDTRFDDCRLRP